MFTQLRLLTGSSPAIPGWALSAGIITCLFLFEGCSPGFGSGTEASPISIPDDEASKVSGRVDPKDPGVLKLDVYNGSSWYVSWIEVEVQREADKVKRSFRAYAMTAVYETKSIRYGQMDLPQRVLKEMRKASAAPLENSTFYASVVDFFAGVKSTNDYQVSILSVMGYKTK